jgi:peptidoglycan-N-acetylglucosamine deacetylase
MGESRILIRRAIVARDDHHGPREDMMSGLPALRGARSFRWLLASALIATTSAAAAAMVPAAPAQAATKYVYLTFDDGPSAYTPQVVSILRTYQVHATFFEIGQNVASNPATTRLVHQAGNSVQNHTWSHRDLRTVTWSYFKYQVNAADSVIRAQTGYTPRCLRPPGGEVNSTVYSRAAALGKTIVLWTVDPRDWSRPGTAAIIRRVLNNVTSGSIVLLHDGGGNRSQTVGGRPADHPQDAQGTWIRVPQDLVLSQRG